MLLDVDDNTRQRDRKWTRRLVLDGPTPRLFDEWQVEPSLWNHLRRAVDDRQQPGQFILTGSAAPTDDITRHTGAARITRLRMRPMSLFETGHATGAISLAEMLAGADGTQPGIDPGHHRARHARGARRLAWPSHAHQCPGHAGHARLPR
ncbi:MAG: AAA family ATPase [Gemmatimonadaceae bacterium]|nr:AAA family ATPase [Gemmatimonadaceae bacterium]